MRLFVLTEDLRVLWEGKGIVENGSIINAANGLEYRRLLPSDTVVTPVEQHYGPDNGVLWVLMRAPDGAALFFSPALKEKGLVYLTERQIAARSGEKDSNCFVKQMTGNPLWFRLIKAADSQETAVSDPKDLGHDTGAATSSGDTLGASGTIVS